MYPKEYIDFLVHFHGDRDFFECHEILEKCWKDETNDVNKQILGGLILLAVANYHHRRGNIPGAKKTLTKAEKVFARQKQNLAAFGFHPDKLLHLVNEKLQEISARKKFSYYNLPIQDKELLEACKRAARQKGFPWGDLQPAVGGEIVHRHLKRDRTPVLRAREKALAMKKKGREC